MMTTANRTPIAELASLLRPALLRLTRLVRNQRVDTSVTLGQLSAMYALKLNGPMTPAELATFEKVQRPSMTKILADLDEHGFVRRDPHPTDGRQMIIAITPSGAALLESERGARDLWLARRLEELTAEERALLERVVPILDKLAQQ